MDELVERISEVISTSLRAEDAVYLLDDKPYKWGTLLFTNTDSHQIVAARVRKNIHALNLKDSEKKFRLNFEMRVGAAEFTQDITSSLQLLEKASKQMEFDV
jgi:hypothetical protein